MHRSNQLRSAKIFKECKYMLGIKFIVIVEKTYIFPFAFSIPKFPAWDLPMFFSSRI